MEKKQIRALALFSGGLDSALAIKLIKDQGIEVIALNFVSHFFGGKNEKAEKMAQQLGVQLEYVNFKNRHMNVVKDPVFGYGKNMNPCIDCHSLMFKVAGELMEKYGADFLISGEVLGQRPMSQNAQALQRVKELSGMGDYIVRPLSAKLLEISKPEELGWVDRDKLLGIEGRSRKYQMDLMEKYNIVDYPSPGGGCLLTDVDYSKKLSQFKDDGVLDNEFSHLFYLTKVSRVFRFSPGNYVFVGRDNDGNHKVMEYENTADHLIRAFDTPGPVIAMFGEFSEEEVNLACQFFSRYSKVKGNSEVSMLLDNKKATIPAIDIPKVEELMKEYQKEGKKRSNPNGQKSHKKQSTEI